jgi:hypothetical protein
MTPEQFAEQLKQAMPVGLRAVVLYGSAAAGDHVAGKSDYNILVVAERFGMAELNALAPVAVKWSEAGNRPPVLFTPGQLAASANAFPIELLDMQQSRRVLAGEDLLAGIQVKPEQLRLALEREWKAKLLQLRERYLLTRGKPARVAGLLEASLSTILVLCRATLRLYQPEVPANKLDAARALAQRLDLDAGVFVTVHETRAGRRKERAAAPLFADYLKAVEQIVAAVDGQLHSTSKGTPSL